jgi:ribosomal protein L34
METIAAPLVTAIKPRSLNVAIYNAGVISRESVAAAPAWKRLTRPHACQRIWRDAIDPRSHLARIKQRCLCFSLSQAAWAQLVAMTSANGVTLSWPARPRCSAQVASIEYGLKGKGLRMHPGWCKPMGGAELDITPEVSTAAMRQVIAARQAKTRSHPINGGWTGHRRENSMVIFCAVVLLFSPRIVNGLYRWVHAVKKSGRQNLNRRAAKAETS